jgi:multicomponent Na+:H+ antiporter subunit E
MGVWLAWSGIFEPKLIIFGVVSVLITVFVTASLDSLDEEGQPIQWLTSMIWYLPWLIKEIIVANVDVIGKVLHPKLNDPDSKIISPTWIKVQANQHSRLAGSLFANSITLTPGTVSVDMGEDYIWVHALSLDGASSLEDGGEMGALVCRVEGGASE